MIIKRKAPAKAANTIKLFNASDVIGPGSGILPVL
jgi:hypothetical protein